MGGGFLERANAAIDEHRVTCSRLVVGWEHGGTQHTVSADVQFNGHTEKVEIAAQSEDEAIEDLQRQLGRLVD